MPRGGGLIYNFPVLREAICEFLYGLEMGDIYDGRDLVTHLSTYHGLSKKDKQNRYVFKEDVLRRSQNFFIQIANRIIKTEELPIVAKYWTGVYQDRTTVLEHEALYNNSRRLYVHIGE